MLLVLKCTECVWPGSTELGCEGRVMNAVPALKELKVTCGLKVSRQSSYFKQETALLLVIQAYVTTHSKLHSHSKFAGHSSVIYSTIWISFQPKTKTCGGSKISPALHMAPNFSTAYWHNRLLQLSTSQVINASSCCCFSYKGLQKIWLDSWHIQKQNTQGLWRRFSIPYESVI